MKPRISISKYFLIESMSFVMGMSFVSQNDSSKLLGESWCPGLCTQAPLMVCLSFFILVSHHPAHASFLHNLPYGILWTLVNVVPTSEIFSRSLFVFFNLNTFYSPSKSILSFGNVSQVPILIYFCFCAKPVHTMILHLSHCCVFLSFFCQSN